MTTAAMPRRFGLLFFCLFFACCRLSAQINAQQVLLLGRSALYYDDFVTAINYFNSVIEAKPYMADAYYYRAYAKFSLEDYESAEQDLSQAVLFNPFRAEYYQLRGLCRIHNGRYEDAIGDYSRVIEEQPTDQGSLYNRVLCRMETHDFDVADAELDDILHRWPKFTRAYLIKAQVRLELKDSVGGMFWVDSLLNISRREPSAWAFKGRYALQHDDYTLADSCMTQAIKYDVGNAEYYISRAQARHALSHYNLALADYDRVIEMIPQHFVAHYNRGLIRATVGDDNRAIEDFDFVIREEPDNVLAIYNRAVLRKSTGDYRGAIADYSVLIAEYPNFLYGYAQRAECYRMIGATAKALRDETHVQRANFDLLFGSRRQKNVKAVRRRSEIALEQYDQLVEEDADTTRTYVSELAGKIQNRKVERVFLPVFGVEGSQLIVKGGCQPVFCTDEQVLEHAARITSLQQSSSRTEALEYMRRVVADGQRDAVSLYNLGCLEAEIGSLEEALRDFTAASELDPRMAEAFYNKAVIYLLQGDYEQAAPLLSKSGEMGLYKAYNLLKQAKKK